MKLTDDNYYSLEADIEFFSVSQYKSFMRCPAMTMAKLRGEYSFDPTTPMLVGSYIDAFMEGTVETFRNEHPEMFTKQGELKAEFKKANKIIEKIQSDDLFMQFMSGEKQKILTFEMFGAKWKMKMDSFLPDRCITDLKVMSSFNNLPNWRYDIQGAIYQKGVELNGLGKLPFYLAVATKEDIPDLDIFQIPQSVLDLALEEVEQNMEHFIAVKNGEVEPGNCGECPYCKSVKKASVRNYVDLLE